MDGMERLAKAVPARVAEVCERLTQAGFQAVTVGGAVRDALLGREPTDWDVATSAHPEDVMVMFRHTEQTGIKHGTVTVVTGKGKHTHVEVTTFRGEGAYSDARRPDHVTFGVPLHEDLARRDLTVNAIAYDPARKELIDPFNGREDLVARRLRAVGKAVDRFTEDGLRVMRAVRFCAQLEFDLDPETEAGIPPALPSLAMVSRERVCDELRKMLATRQPSRGFAPARRTGIIKSILPDLDAAIADEAGWLAMIDRAQPDVRLAVLLAPLATTNTPATNVDPTTQRRVLLMLRELKFSNVEAEIAAQLVGIAHCALPATRDHALLLEAVALRRLLRHVDRDKRNRVVPLWDALVPKSALAELAAHVLEDKPPLDVGDLAIRGKELMDALQMKPGPAVGRILADLLDFVIAEPARNTRSELLAKAQQLELEVAHDDDNADRSDD
jgi:tRNA nucleotidyltransferase (CCA-adding enzyme)